MFWSPDACKPGDEGARRLQRIVDSRAPLAQESSPIVGPVVLQNRPSMRHSSASGSDLQRVQHACLGRSSVDNEDDSWQRRFRAQVEKRPDTPVLSDSPELSKWLQFKRGSDIWQSNSLRLRSEALSLAPKNLMVIGL